MEPSIRSMWQFVVVCLCIFWLRIVVLVIDPTQVG
jgi:hypothetical protein